jgi:hypothetical protein
MKVHAPVSLPLPMLASAPSPAAKEALQLASDKARLAFEQALGAKSDSGSGQSAQAGYKSRGGRGTAPFRRAAAPPAAPSPAAAPAAPSGDAAALAANAPYIPGSLVNIKA